jgi:hypothetical protein
MRPAGDPGRERESMNTRLDLGDACAQQLEYL